MSERNTSWVDEMIVKYPTIPRLIIEGLDSYLQDRIPTGSFLRAVLSNDLRESFNQADLFSRAVLGEIVKLCYWDIPGGAWGSPEAVRSWLNPEAQEE